MASINLNTSGMRRGASSIPMETIVSRLPGVSRVTSDRAKGQTHLEFDPAVVPVEKIVAALHEAGYVLGRDWFAS